jgi:hypothetical protein
MSDISMGSIKFNSRRKQQDSDDYKSHGSSDGEVFM